MIEPTPLNAGVRGAGVIGLSNLGRAWLNFGRSERRFGLGIHGFFPDADEWRFVSSSWPSSIDCDEVLVVIIPGLSLDCMPTGRPLMQIFMRSKSSFHSTSVWRDLRRLGRDWPPCATDRRSRSVSFNLRRLPNRSISSTGANVISSGRVADTTPQSGSCRSWRFSVSDWLFLLLGMPWGSCVPAGSISLSAHQVLVGSRRSSDHGAWQ